MSIAIDIAESYLHGIRLGLIIAAEHLSRSGEPLASQEIAALASKPVLYEKNLVGFHNLTDFEKSQVLEQFIASVQSTQHQPETQPPEGESHPPEPPETA